MLSTVTLASLTSFAKRSVSRLICWAIGSDVLLRRVANRLGTHIVHTLFEVRRLNGANHFKIEPAPNLFGRAGRGQYTKPGAEVKALEPGLIECRHIGQGRRAFADRDGQRAQLACLDMGQDRRDGVKRQVDLSVKKIGR